MYKATLNDTYRMPRTSLPAEATELRDTLNAQQKPTRQIMDKLRVAWDLESYRKRRLQMSKSDTLQHANTKSTP
jgi:hypothetical protein